MSREAALSAALILSVCATYCSESKTGGQQPAALRWF